MINKPLCIASIIIFDQVGTAYATKGVSLADAKGVHCLSQRED